VHVAHYSRPTVTLIAEVNRYRWLERRHRSYQESIMRIEDQLFTVDIERRMCVSRLEAARAFVTVLTGRTLDSAVMTTRAEMYH
jgi:hypothetical protein